AAAASSFALRFRQSRSRMASRLSASRLVSSSSSVSTGTATRALSRVMNASTREVASEGVPSSRLGMPTTIVDNPSASSASSRIRPATRLTASASLVTAIVSSGRASVRDASLIARPTRRVPTSTASTRPFIPQCYNFTPPKPVKRLLLISLAVCLGAATACGTRRAPEKFQQKLVILGFDGMDPRLVQRWMDDGKLPNMQKLAKRGSGVRTLTTTHSPESPTAWASFATGVNAGKHNIYDFLVRDNSSYLPDLGMVTREPPRFLLNYIPVSRPKITSIRGGTSFWVTAGKAGVRSSMLTVPVTYPPEDVENGEMLSGLPLPDIRGTMGTFYYFGTDLSRYEEGNTEFGGILKRLVFDGDVAQTELVGPPNPIVRQQLRAARARTPRSEADKMKIAELEAREDVRVPLAIHWNRAEKSATITLGDNTIHLTEHQWSKWINLDFSINLLVRVHGMAQVYLINAGQELQLYVSPVNWRPDNPPGPMSSPRSFSADLYERLGPYRTLGWAEATWPLNEDRLDEKPFMDDLYRAFDDRAQVILQRLDAKQWDLLVGVIESTDRVQHMMWRLIDPAHPMYDKALAAKYGDAIERVYRRCDDFVGEVMARVPKDTPILIVSDHGFHSFRQSVNLNTWLVQEGFMALQGQAPGEKKLKDLFGGGGTFWENVDWSRTRAYAMGLGQIYI